MYNDIIDNEFHISFRSASFKFLSHSPCKSSEIDIGPLDFSAGYAGQLEQIIDDQRHSIACFADVLKIYFPLFVQLRGIFLSQHATECGDSAQWPSKVMGDRIAE